MGCDYCHPLHLRQFKQFEYGSLNIMLVFSIHPIQDLSCNDLDHCINRCVCSSRRACMAPESRPRHCNRRTTAPCLTLAGCMARKIRRSSPHMFGTLKRQTRCNPVHDSFASRDSCDLIWGEKICVRCSDVFRGAVFRCLSPGDIH